jgi:hypothetical protein
MTEGLPIRAQERGSIRPFEGVYTRMLLRDLREYLGIISSL